MEAAAPMMDLFSGGKKNSYKASPTRRCHEKEKKSNTWVSLPWLAHDEAPGQYIAIPQYRFNKTKQHTRHTMQGF